METKVTKRDLVGDLEGFPIEVVEKMLQEQYKQFGKKDISIFQNNKRSENGFVWEYTIEGHDFWRRVISCKEFDVFFELYPKVSKTVYIRGDVTNAKNVIKELESRGGINKLGYTGSASDMLYFIDPITNYISGARQTEEPLQNLLKTVYTEISPIVELTMEEIADKLGVDVNKLRIKK